MLNSGVTHVIIIIVFLSIEELFASSNLTDFMKLRGKRSVIFQGGSVKFSVSGIWPLYLEDRVNWRQMNCLASLQTQYDLPSKPLDLLSNGDLPFAKSLRTMREDFDKTGSFTPDPSRMFTYAALEEFMNRNGRNGRECLLRSICENAQIDDHVDVFSKILDVILTPGKDEMDEVYREAVEAGKFGANCFASYPKCLYGDSFLDRIAVVT